MAQHSDEIESVHLGHADVGNDELDFRMLIEQVQRFPDRACGDDGVIGEFQHRLQGREGIGVVVDEEDRR